jgi:hypothetical protein
MTATQLATLFFCLALCLGLLAVASKISRVDQRRLPTKSTTSEHEASHRHEVAAHDRVHQAQKKHLTRWLAETAALFQEAPIVVREATPRRRCAGKSPRATGRTGCRRRARSQRRPHRMI